MGAIEGDLMKSIGKVIILMILVIFFTFTFAACLKWFGINEGPLTKIVPFISMLIGTVVFLKLIDRKDFIDIGLHNFLTVLDYTMVAMILALLPLILGIVINRRIQLTQSIDLSVIVTFLYCFLIGFSEELLYRGYIYSTVSVKKLKLTVSAVAFAGFHFISPEFNAVLFLFYLLYGVIKVGVFKRIKNIWPLILFHFVWDVAATYTDFYSNPIIDILSLFVTLIVMGFMAKCKENKALRNKII
jgi:membrane protease YdiL (CAAX protease family)